MTTFLESKLLRNIAENDYQRSDSHLDPVWSDALQDGPEEIELTSIPGVLGSLVKKGLVESDGFVVWLTKAGLQAYKEA